MRKGLLVQYPGIDWSPRNRAALADFVRRHPGGGIVAVDWDGTCIHHDIAAIRFCHAVYEGFVDFSAEAVAELVPYPRLRAELARLARSHRRRDRLLRLGAAIGVFEAIHRQFGITASFPWTPSLYGGHTRRELAEFTRRILEHELHAPVGNYPAPVPPAEYWAETPLSPPTHYLVATGIRAYRPMLEMLAGLRASGFRVFVISAADEIALGMSMAAAGFVSDGMAGMCIAADADVLRHQVLEPMTVADGKIGALAAVAGDGAPPLLVAGDTGNDLALLNHASDMCLLVDHGKPWFGQLRSALRAGRQVLVQPQFITAPATYTGEHA